MDDVWVGFGRVGRPHGLRGELRFHPFNTETRHLDELERVRLAFDDERVEMRVRGVRRGAAALLLSLYGVSTRDDASRWSGATVEVPAETFEPLDEGEYYGYQLEGLVVVDEKGDRVGSVVEYTNFGAGDLLLIRTDSGREEYLPFADPYVGEIDLERGTVVASLNLYLDGL